MTGSGINSLILDEFEVLNITDGLNALAGTANTLVVTTDNDDLVTAGGFTDSGVDVTIAGQAYSVFDGNTTDATLLVDNDISAALA